MKSIYLIAGIVLTLSLRASDKDAWTIFMDRENQVWSVLESDLLEYSEILCNRAACSHSPSSPGSNCICFKQTEDPAFQAGPQTKFFYSRKRSRLNSQQKKSASCS